MWEWGRKGRVREERADKELTHPPPSGARSLADGWEGRCRHGSWGFLKALTLSLRTAWWLPGGCVGWIPRAVGFLWVDRPHTGRSPAFIPGLNESTGQRAEAGKGWRTVSIRMSVGGRAGKDHPHCSRKRICTWPITKNSLTGSRHW